MKNYVIICGLNDKDTRKQEITTEQAKTALAGIILDYVVKNFPESDGLTYRRIIQWIAEISGTCAYIDWDGKLCFGWYDDNDFSLSPSERYSSDMYEQDITITGVQITDEDDNTFLAGTDDYAFNIENNGLIQDKQTEIATAIYNKVAGFTYRPYTCTCKPLPYVYPLDGVSYTDKNGVKHNSIVTGVTFKMNASMIGQEEISEVLHTLPLSKRLWICSRLCGKIICRTAKLTP